MRMYDVILKKRNGGELTEAEIRYFVLGFAKGEIPDYQMAALMMAIWFKGMNIRETLQLTEAMIDSGERIDLSAIGGIKVDKHSTGGVGDKTSIVLTPLVAAAGVPVAKMTGRGLGHTGGTIDKLECFEGFSVNMDQAQFIDRVNRIGIALAGQTKALVPADKMIYALRDLTATVDNLSLIAGSIMSKKLASGADAIVLDVKTGSGAFMSEPTDAFELARIMVDLGQQSGKRTTALITDMDQPLGLGIGNALEIKEAIDTLKGGGPADLKALVMELGSRMLVFGGKADSVPHAKTQLQSLIDSGAAFDKLKVFIAEQGGNPAQADNPDLLPDASNVVEMTATESGYITSLNAQTVGLASMMLGAGRETKESQLDLGAGILLAKKKGDHVEAGEVLATLYTNSPDKLQGAMNRMEGAYAFSATAGTNNPLIFGEVNETGTVHF